MKRPAFIARQSGKPSGVMGRVIAWIMARETAELNGRAVELLALEPTDQVLEIGFGHARTVERIAAAIPDGRVAGVDLSESMTRRARRRNRRAIADGRIDLRVGDCAALPYDQGQFDKALSVHTLYFWRDPAACLAQILRVLRPGGRLVLAFTPKGSPRTASFPAAIYTFYDRDQVHQLLLDAGFATAEINGAGAAAIAVATAPPRR